MLHKNDSRSSEGKIKQNRTNGATWHITAAARESSDLLSRSGAATGHTPQKGFSEQQGRPPTFLAWKEARFSRSEDSSSWVSSLDWALQRVSTHYSPLKQRSALVHRAIWSMLCRRSSANRLDTALLRTTLRERERERAGSSSICRGRKVTYENTKSRWMGAQSL